MALCFGFLSLVSVKGSEIVLGIQIPTLDGFERSFFFGSQEENVLALAVSCNNTYVLITFMMNYKCQPVELYLEQTINVLMWLLLWIL